MTMIWVCESISLGSAAEWFGGAMELFVALVILWELRENRLGNVLSEVLQFERRKERFKLEEAFFNLEVDAIEARRIKFCELVKTQPKLEQKCVNQIVYFSNLWYVLRSAKPFYYRCMPRRCRELDAWFPHDVVPFWLVAGLYVIERQEELGPWTSHYLMNFTLESIAFLRSQKPFVAIKLRKRDISISETLLTELEREIERNFH